MKFRVLGLASAVCLAILATDAKAQNLVVNGGFEQPVVSPSQFATFGFGSTAITGWTVISGTQDPGAGSVDVLGTYQMAHSGTQSVDLDGTSAPTSAGGLRQTINGLVVGQNYVLDFFYSNNPFGTTSSALVTIDGLSASITHSGAAFGTPNYTEFTRSFTASATSLALSFASTDPAVSQTGILLDDVSVTAATATPEPASLAMLGLGLAATGAVTRFRRRNA